MSSENTNVRYAFTLTRANIREFERNVEAMHRDREWTEVRLKRERVSASFADHHFVFSTVAEYHAFFTQAREAIAAFHRTSGAHVDTTPVVNTPKPITYALAFRLGFCVGFTNANGHGALTPEEKAELLAWLASVEERP